MFSVSSGGTNTQHPAAFLMSRPNGLSEYLFLLVKCAAVFEVDHTVIPTEPGCFLLIAPGTPYSYRSQSGEYMDDWMHFSCSDSSLDLLHQIPLHQPVFLSNTVRITQYLQQILWEKSYAPPEFRAVNADLLMQVLFHSLAAACLEKDCAPSYSPYRTRLQNLRLTIQSEPHKQYNPAAIASSLGISLSYFQHLYSSLFGLPFQADLIRLRIESAKELLLHSNLTVEQIALMCGYSGEVHFYRQFKKYTGMTPTAFRRQQP